MGGNMLARVKPPSNKGIRTINKKSKNKLGSWPPLWGFWWLWIHKFLSDHNWRSEIQNKSIPARTRSFLAASVTRLCWNATEKKCECGTAHCSIYETVCLYTVSFRLVCQVLFNSAWLVLDNGPWISSKLVVAIDVTEPTRLI